MEPAAVGRRFRFAFGPADQFGILLVAEAGGHRKFRASNSPAMKPSEDFASVECASADLACADLAGARLAGEDIPGGERVTEELGAAANRLPLSRPVELRAATVSSLICPLEPRICLIQGTRDTESANILDA